ncbi:Component of a membrane-bound complex containing the Tor2p kinase [Coemansia spiralis]|uniref:Component of a membrane-bound complex containing the Tor2p kinase n=1 Tax=Coemansia spiralis TaxID=417178 RepID=A0A9W8L462_9FUNG|nr:Component of a membrane-bound complex containing the Tor2p kinase [Coemansia spiralis]
MALVNDPAFLIYQLRVSFLRANDPTGERVLTFNDLAVPHTGSGAARGRQGSAPSPMSPAARRNTTASELRQQVAQNTAANAYIMACGYYPETETVGSPEIDHNEGYMYSRPAPRMAHTGTGIRGQDGGTAPPPSARYPGGAGAAGRTKRTNRSAKVAPTGEGREEVVGLGVVPQHPEMLLDEYVEQDTRGLTYADSGEPPPSASRRSLDTVRPRPLAVVDEITDPGSLSDSVQTPVVSEQGWPPKNMPPRRSLDTIQRPDGSLSAQTPASHAAARGDRKRYQGHAASSSVATIRLQRPSEFQRKGSSRDAMALGIDFDVKSMFEDNEQHVALREGSQHTAATSPALKVQERQPPSSKASTDSASSQDCTLDQDRLDSRVAGAMPTDALRPKRQGSESVSQSSQRGGSGSIALRAKRSDASTRTLLSNQREDSGGATAPGLKRSVTLPTKRPGAYHYHGGAAGQKSKWVGGAYVDTQHQQGSNQASGWVGGAEQTSWDQSSDDDDDTTPLSRRGASTHTWYGPRVGTRPISMFPPPGANVAYPIPPMPLMFGADDSDDDIDLEGDDGSSRTPALIGLGFGRGLLRPRAASPTPSLPSHRNSIIKLSTEKKHASRLLSKPALATSVPVPSPLSATPIASAVSGVKYEYLSQESSGSRPRGISDPEGRLSARGSKAELPQLAALSPNARLGGNGDSMEPLRAADNSAPLVSARALDWSFKGACNAAALGSKSQVGGLADLTAKFEYVPPLTPAKSGLSALLSSKIEIRQNPFSEEFSAIGNASGGPNLLGLKVFVLCGGGAQSQLLNVKVRQNATVEQVIGFALHRYIDDGLTPPLEPDVQDVVMWALRIAEDGEVDDDFPALDRTRPASSFGYDEFALCLSTPDQIKQNEDIRVRQGRPPRMIRPKSLLPVASASSAATPPVPSSADGPDGSVKRNLYCKISHRVEVSTVVLQPSRAATSSTAGIFVGTAGPSRLASQMPTPFGKPQRRPSSPGSNSSAMCESRLFKIRVLDEPQSAEALRTTTVDTDSSATIEMVLALVCRKKQFSEDRYALGVLEGDQFIALDSGMRVSQIPLGVELCLQKIGTTSLAPELSDRALRWSTDGGVSGALLTGTARTSAVDGSGAESSSVYHTFRVIRRAQMFTRHERSLVIDGDVVTLMPSDHRIETAKTLTFHISNIVCKRNQKSPKKIRLFISRRGSTGEKSVDLEAMTEEDALQICNILLQLHDQYVSNGT